LGPVPVNIHDLSVECFSIYCAVSAILSITLRYEGHRHNIVDYAHAIRAAQTGVYSFFDVSGFKASFGRKRLTDIDRRPVRNSDIQVKNACLSGPIRAAQTGVYRFFLRFRIYGWFRPEQDERSSPRTRL
jgi:hypothetical protein